MLFESQNLEELFPTLQALQVPEVAVDKVIFIYVEPFE